MSRLGILVALAAWPQVVHAQGAAEEIVVGVYLPLTPIASVADKAKLVTNLGKHLTGELGRPVTARSYAKAEDLIKDAALLSFVLVDAPLAGGAFDPLAAARWEGRARTQLVVYGTGDVTAAWALEGKRLAYPRMGSATNDVIDNFVFERHFSLARVTRVTVPDVASALAAVQVGKADAVVLTQQAYEVLGGGGLRPVVTSRDVPLAVFCRAQKPIDGAVADRARTAMSGFSFTAAGISGFGGVEGSVLAAFRGMTSQGPRYLPDVAEAQMSLKGPSFTYATPEVPLAPVRRYLAPSPRLPLP